ncbi:hypothetical protein NPIL_568211 [Nephila pilipes]|uniref:Uncharacterized protein n=1 Tax=Nephila pilipes TaxID=299642 RepID=A0A8X6K0B5_NEPPI|nr:hypothetical protein NPIL_568211 [Nephila pilipes]
MSNSGERQILSYRSLAPLFLNTSSFFVDGSIQSLPYKLSDSLQLPKPPFAPGLLGVRPRSLPNCVSPLLSASTVSSGIAPPGECTVVTILSHTWAF